MACLRSHKTKQRRSFKAASSCRDLSVLSSTYNMLHIARAYDRYRHHTSHPMTSNTEKKNTGCPTHHDGSIAQLISYYASRPNTVQFHLWGQIRPTTTQPLSYQHQRRTIMPPSTVKGPIKTAPRVRYYKISNQLPDHPPAIADQKLPKSVKSDRLESSRGSFLP